MDNLIACMHAVIDMVKKSESEWEDGDSTMQYTMIVDYDSV